MFATKKVNFRLICTLAVIFMLNYTSSNGQSSEIDSKILNAANLATRYNEIINAPSYQQGYQLQDLESSATGYGGEDSKGSLIGGFLGDVTGNVLRQILKSLTGIGIKLGVNLNNEFYNVPEYGYGGGYSHGYGYGNGYGNGNAYSNRRGYGIGDGYASRGGYAKSNNYANGYSNIQETISNVYEENQRMKDYTKNVKN